MTVYGTTELTAIQVETHAGDGHNRLWVAAFPFGMAPVVMVNGAHKTVGIKGVDTGKDFYWSMGDPVLLQDRDALALADSATLQIIYVGRLPVVHAMDEEPPAHLTVTVDSKDLARVLLPQIVNELRSKPGIRSL